jgi:hypothetical protein
MSALRNVTSTVVLPLSLVLAGVGCAAQADEDPKDEQTAAATSDQLATEPVAHVGEAFGRGGGWGGGRGGWGGGGWGGGRGWGGGGWGGGGWGGGWGGSGWGGSGWGGSGWGGGWGGGRGWGGGW